MCWELVGEQERGSMVVDLSTQGARLERPYVPVTYVDYDGMELGPAGRSRYVSPPATMSRFARVPMQIELPGLDEVLWARGDVVFDELVPVKSLGGPFGLMRRTGVHISLGARRDLDLLSDFVWETHRKREQERRARELGCDSVDWNACFA